MKDKIKIGISQGDINGISYEVIIKSLLDTRINDLCIPIVYGSAKVAAYHRKALNINNFSFNTAKSAEDVNPKRANIINCINDNIKVELGKSTKAAGSASVEALEMATNDLMDNKIDALVTGPIIKYNTQSEKFNYPGHTDYLQDKFKANGVLMFMVNELFKIGVVTAHVPISKVHEYITIDTLLNKLGIMNNSLIKDFGIRKPKIAVLGLNPHAGENGMLGKEEQTAIIPAIEEANKNNILAFGPFPADGFFGSGAFTKFDGIMAMYHDQGLVPFKTLSYEGGVNYTAGLPIVRTSPAHGTAFEIAGKGMASEKSFRKAIYLACDIYKCRKEHKALTSNPLKTYNVNDL